MFLNSRTLGWFWKCAKKVPLQFENLNLPNVWSSDLSVRNMFLNSQTLGRSWETLLGIGFGFGFGFGFNFGVAVGVASSGFRARLTEFG